VLDRGPQVLRDSAMTTNFWLSIGYNFGSIIDSDTRAFDSIEVGFFISESSYPTKTQPRSSV